MYRSIKLEFEYFDLEAGLEGADKGEELCIFDSLVIETDDPASKSVVCGHWGSSRLTSLNRIVPSDFLRITFHSDHSNAGSGYRLKVKLPLSAR